VNSELLDFWPLVLPNKTHLPSPTTETTQPVSLDRAIMRRTAKFVSDAASQLARRIPKREKPWSSTQIAVQQKRMKDNMASSLLWFSNSWEKYERNPSEGNNDVLLLFQGKQQLRVLPPWANFTPA
jgi:hypothetical protein